jgi:hypothetical protein
MRVVDDDDVERPVRARASSAGARSSSPGRRPPLRRALSNLLGPQFGQAVRSRTVKEERFDHRGVPRNPVSR